eukprot:6213673-Pleurochrysis_carterae.AAC.2
MKSDLILTGAVRVFLAIARIKRMAKDDATVTAPMFAWLSEFSGVLEIGAGEPLIARLSPISEKAAPRQQPETGD